MEPTEEQLTALGNYRDIIIQHVPEIAEAIGVSPQTLTGWMEDIDQYKGTQIGGYGRSIPPFNCPGSSRAM